MQLQVVETPYFYGAIPESSVGCTHWIRVFGRFFVGDLDYMHGRRTPEAVT